MEKVVNSKKNLLDRWQKALQMMQKRDALIQIASDELRSENEKNILLKSELNGLRTEIRKEEEINESLNMQSDNIAKQKQQI